MSVLLSSEIYKLIDCDFIKDTNKGLVGPASLDVRFHSDFFLEAKEAKVVDPSQGEFPKMHHVIGDLFLPPGGFCLASTKEMFTIPPFYTMRFSLTSTLARCGLDQMIAVDAHPGWEGRLTLELKNSLQNHTLCLSAGAICGQVQFQTVIGASDEYDGKYQFDDMAQPARF